MKVVDSYLLEEELPWKPFGLTLTYNEWKELVTWYIQKRVDDTLNTKEGKQCLETILPRP